MEIFIGFILNDKIVSQKRYDSIINEIRHLLKAHSEEVLVHEDSTKLQIKPLEFQTFEFMLFKEVEYVNTNYFRVATQEYLSDSLQVFVEICWECIIIFKENFPSKVIMYQNNLKLILDFEINEFEQEIYRRELNQIRSKLYDEMNLNLKEDEIEDVFQVIQDSIYYKDYKGLCLNLDLMLKDIKRITLNQNRLKILNELAKELYFVNNNANKFDLSQNMNESMYPDENEDINYRQYQIAKQKAQQILNNYNNREVFIDSNKESKRVSQQSSLRDLQFSESKLDIRSSKKKVNLQSNFSDNFYEPKQLQSQLFQLKETYQIERITFIFNGLLKNPQKLQQLNKMNLVEVFRGILTKYSEGKLGIDQSYLTKNLIFHNRLLSYFIASLETIKRDMECQNIYQLMIQILEEGFYNLVENYKQIDINEPQEKETFVQQFIKIHQILSQQLNDRMEFDSFVQGIQKIDVKKQPYYQDLEIRNIIFSVKE